MASRPPFSPPALLDRQAASPGGVSLGDSARVRVEAHGLLEYLMSPADGETPPPARGLHPLTGIPLGLAVEAAIHAVDGKRRGIDVVRACTVEFHSPAPVDRPLVAEARVRAIGRRHVDLEAVVRAEEDPARVVLSAGVVLVRVIDGRAADLAKDER